MKHKFKYLLMFIIIFFYTILPVYASSEYVVLLDAVNVRKGPGTTYDRIELGRVGSTYNLRKTNIIADEPNNGACDAGWYEVDVNGSKGYVCSTYVRAYIDLEEDNTEAKTACQAELKSAGFPSSYWDSLCSLKSRYPKWQFKTIETKLDWSTAVNKFTSCGNSLLYNPRSDWKDSSCSYNEGGYVTVNQSGVAYYLDPRNFLTESYIFQFEYNRYNSALESAYPSIVKSIIENTDFYKYHNNLGNDLPSLVASGGKQTNINPVHLASRMYQELGTSTRLQNLYKGVFNGPIQGVNYDFRGYYNFYNIGVTGACVTVGKGATYCGLTTAKNNNWNSVSSAITGGGTFLDSNYVGVGQYTSYLERFNVVPTKSTSMYLHYYMANLQAPSSEALTSYNAYKKNNLLDSAFEFYIPVYNNMNAEIVNSSSGAVNTPDEPKSSESMSISSIISSAGFRSSGSLMLGINPHTSGNSIKSALEANAGSGNVTITNANNQTITDNAVGTGSKVTIKTSAGTETFTIVIKGDTSGDGVINALDLLQIQKSILGTYSLKDSYKTAGDTSSDNTINALDLLQIQKNILGTYDIRQ